MIHFQIFNTHGIQTLNVYEMLHSHSLYTKRCSLAMYETPVYETLVTPNEDITMIFGSYIAGACRGDTLKGKL